MFSKLTSKFSKKKKKKTPGSINRQSTFFDEESSRGVFRRRKQNNFGGGDFSKKLSQIYKTQKVFMFLGCITVFILLGIFLLLGPFLKIDKIFIEQEGSISNINQIYDNVDYIRGQNLLLVDTQEISNRIKKNQNTIQDVRFETALPQTLNIYIKSYQPLFQTNGYLIAENGALVPQEEILDNLPLLKISEDLYEKALFDRVLDSRDLGNIIFLQNELSRNILGFVPKTLYYLPTEKELLLESSNGNIFIFDISSDIAKQVRGLAIFSKEGGNVTAKKYIYIDIRIPQKLFLCDYENEFSCIKNLKNIYGETIFENFPEDVSPPEQ